MRQEKIFELYKGKVKIKFIWDPDNSKTHEYYLVKEDNNKRLCGVTTHIGVLDKPALIPWAVSVAVDFIRDHMDVLKETDDPDEILKMARAEADKQKDVAADIGKAIHTWIESHIKGEEPDMPEDPKVIQGVNSFLDWVNENKVTFLWSERVVYSKKHGYVGTADLGIKIGINGHRGKKYLADIKTGNGIYAEVKQQTAAYEKALEEEGDKYDGRWALRISKDTEEEYLAKQKKKLDAGKIKTIPPYKVFEALFLDKDSKSIDRDFKAYLASIEEYEWKKVAETELKELRTA